jgi:predicted PurR-regulated permease PerM
LFFLIGSQKLRRQLITYFGTREARLRAVRIWNDIEHNLITYVGTVSVINIGVGAMTAAMLYVLGFPSPLAFGILAFALNYIPYIGPAIIVATLFGVGLVTTPSLGAAILPPLLFVGMTTIEGHFLTPSVIGRRLTLSPFLVFLALAFWTWLWGPFGAFMATPLLIVGLVVLGHLFPRDEDPALPQ